ncbi:TVP38/TMEM64 family protein [Patescibacteria group bacterium]|nr:TVP38/TMEM64 family protein [Patescibacteria group bacterium]
MSKRTQKKSPAYLPTRINVLRFLVIVIPIVALLYYLSGEISDTHALSQANIEAFIKQAGVFSWLVYLVLVILAVLGPITSSTIAIIGGYLFNPFLAIGLNMAGELIGAAGNFLIGKKLGKRYLVERFPKVKAMVTRYGAYLNPFNIFLLGLVPVGTSNLTGYVAGMSGMKFKRYIYSWMVALFFVNIFITFLGYSAKIHSLPLTLGIVMVIMISVWFVKKASAKMSKK